jgi:adenylate cyclase
LADIFVSYSRQDKALVAPLVASLEAEGWSVWRDPEITPGEEFDSLVSRKLEGAGALVVVWTPHSVDSRWVRGEARDAADRGVLVPVRFQNAKLPIDFRAVHTTDLDQWGEDAQGAAFRGLCKALAAKVGEPTKPVSAQAIPDKKPAVSICVLPFANMSGDPEQEYFSDGITEDIITDLGKVSALSIVSRNMAFSFKGAKGGVGEIGRQTKASHVLVGSVRKAGAGAAGDHQRPGVQAPLDGQAVQRHGQRTSPGNHRSLVQARCRARSVLRRAWCSTPGPGTVRDRPEGVRVCAGSRPGIV